MIAKCAHRGCVATDRYRKTHPGITELPTFNAGDELPVFRHPKVTFGIQICCRCRAPLPPLCARARAPACVSVLDTASPSGSLFLYVALAPGRLAHWLVACSIDDTHFPIPAALLAEKGAQLVFAPHASAVEVVSALATTDAHFAPGRTVSRETGAMKLERWLRYVPARAYDNSVYVAICNQCGLGPAADAEHRRTAGGGASFNGGSVSFVCGPTGEIIAGGDGGSRGDFGEESLLVHVLEAAELERVRSSAISFFRRWHHPKTREWANAIEGSKL